MDTNEVAILTSFIGVCGTLLGTILGWILNSLSNKGKLYFSDFEIDKKYVGLNENRVRNCTDDKNKAASYYFTISLNAYNSSNNIKPIKNIRLQFYNYKKLITSVIPNDDSTFRVSGAFSVTDKAKVYNIQPKNIEKFKFSYAFHKDITDIINANRVNLTYQNENGKNKTIKLV